MDVAVTSPIGGSETQHHSYNALHLSTEQSSPPAQQRRHVHYSTPETSTPLSPRLVYEAAANHTVRSSPSNTRNTSSMSQNSSTRAFTLETSEALPLPVHNGQNHDRMETDMESDDSSSEDEEQGPPNGATHSGLMEVEPPEEGEIMDTTPDAPSIAVEGVATVNGTATVDAPTSPNPNLVRISSNGSSIDSNADDLTLPNVIIARGVHPATALAPTSTPPLSPANGLEFAHTSVPPVVDPDADSPTATVRANENDSQEEDSDEEDVPYWANFKEDLSQPDEQELKAIEKDSNEVSAFDHDHWERITYEALDDPEYIPGASGRITWVVKGVNGTPEKPNRETLMRSPSVLIGGYYWNIKYFPRGDEGTQYMSVFIECSTTPRAELLTEALGTERPIQATGEPAPSANLSDSATLIVGGGGLPISDTPETLRQPSLTSPAGEVAEEDTPKIEKGWDVAAQVGCVVYNPKEPRVHASQTSSHHFYSDYPDFGWIRFHGPWDEIHKRQEFQRQALLRNDTLVFTAYVRITKDDTKALWWHAPKDTYKWDSLARTGLRRFTTGTLHSSALISAVSSWLNLRTIADVILNMRIPDPFKDSKSRPRPLFLALQDVVSDYFNKRTPRDPEASLDGVIKAMEWYGAEIDSKMDVVAIWEMIRRILSYEASNTVNIAGAPDLFPNVLILRQPDPWRDEQPILDSSASHGPKQPRRHIEPHSVQEAFDLAVTGEPRTFRSCEAIGQEQQNWSDPPSLLQIELHRQSYNKELRQWRKLTHQIKINETLIVNPPDSNRKLEYTLKGMIVHSGDLESKNYSAVIRRPQAASASWVAFAGEQEEKSVTYLTRKQAITSHEGSGDHATGDAAVAYVVLYERADSLWGILLTSPVDLGETKFVKTANTPVGESLEPGSSQKEAAIDMENHDRTLSIHVYPSTSYINYAGRGFLDAGRWPGWGSFQLHMPARTTVSEVSKHIISQATGANGSEKSRQLRLWALDFGDQQYPRGSPGLHIPRSEQWADLSLEKFAQITGGCHFWLHESPKQAEDASMVHTGTDPRPASMPSTPTGASSLGGTQAVENQVPEELASTSPVGHDEQNLRASSDTSRTPEDEDTVMDGVSEQTVQNPLGASGTAQPGPQNSEEGEDDAYIFLKTFSHQDQILLGKGSYIVQRHEKVKDTVQKLLGPGYPDEVDIYRESYPVLNDVDIVHTNQTFSEIDACDGDIFIAQHRPSAAEITTLETSGKCSTPVSYLKFLRHYDNPSYSLSHHVSSYFSSPYLSTAQSSGRPHGPGTHIALSGDAYVGNFIAGTKSGDGTMAFSNGDTYTGSWADNEPDGQGRMVYAGTGNTYVGGFKKRKRFGKGTMTYEVADEEMQLCRICYEQEMDALFYDCGHVTACVECARQVSVCPVCRRGVRAVVKIWKTF